MKAGKSWLSECHDEWIFYPIHQFFHSWYLIAYYVLICPSFVSSNEWSVPNVWVLAKGDVVSLLLNRHNIAIPMYTWASSAKLEKVFMFDLRPLNDDVPVGWMKFVDIDLYKSCFLSEGWVLEPAWWNLWIPSWTLFRKTSFKLQTLRTHRRPPFKNGGVDPDLSTRLATNTSFECKVRSSNNCDWSQLDEKAFNHALKAHLPVHRYQWISSIWQSLTFWFQRGFDQRQHYQCDLRVITPSISRANPSVGASPCRWLVIRLRSAKTFPNYFQGFADAVRNWDGRYLTMHNDIQLVRRHLIKKKESISTFLFVTWP